MPVFYVIMPNRFGGRDMFEVYVIVEKQKSLVMKFLSALCFVIGAYLVYVALWGWILFMVGGILFFVAGWLLYSRNIEYEYSYFDGEFRFARITNKQKRKELPGYEAKNVLIIAPKGDRSLYQYENGNQIKVRDLSSGKKDAKLYGMVVTTQAGCQLVWFEPDEAYLDAVCIKYGQKVVK